MASEQTTRPRVVVGVDGSAESAAALRWAASYAEATGAEVRAIMAWHYPTTIGINVGVAPPEVSDKVRQNIKDSLHQTVAEALPGAAPDHLAAEVAYGHPAQVLVDASEQADLLVVGSRGHSKLTGLLVGSVSMYCISHAACPVTLVRSAKSAPAE